MRMTKGSKRALLAVAAFTAVGLAGAVAKLSSPSSAQAAGAGVGSGQDHDALTAARFELSIDGVVMASFTELQGITTSVEVVEGLPRQDDGTVVLRRGMTLDMSISAWHEAALAGRLDEARRNASLVFYDRNRAATARYNLQNAWPSKVEISVLDTGKSRILIETVTLVSERISRVVP